MSNARGVLSLLKKQITKNLETKPKELLTWVVVPHLLNKSKNKTQPKCGAISCWSASPILLRIEALQIYPKTITLIPITSLILILNKNMQ